MRVLQLIDSLAPGGTERSLISSAPHLIERHGIDLHIATMTPRLDLADQLVDLGVEPTVIGGDSRFQSIRNIQSLLGAVRPDVVHTQLFEATVAGIAAARKEQVPRLTSLVSTEFGASHYQTPDLRRTRVAGAHLTASIAAAMTHRFHAVSQAVADHGCKRLRIDPAKVTVIPRGRDGTTMGRRNDDRRSRTRSALGVALGRSLVLVVARHEYPKAIDTAIGAFARHIKDDPTAVLVIAGPNGSQTEVLYSVADKEGVTDCIQFLGARDDVADLMTAADVLCFPSRREGMPGTLIEALALELPIVATDIGPNREVLGPDAALVPVDDTAAMASALAESLNRDNSGDTIAGRARFEQHFTIERSVAQQVELYQETVEAGTDA